jgi:hypothetical protein
MRFLLPFTRSKKASSYHSFYFLTYFAHLSIQFGVKKILIKPVKRDPMGIMHFQTNHWELLRPYYKAAGNEFFSWIDRIAR